jgi:hypothetical protein
MENINKELEIHFDYNDRGDAQGRVVQEVPADVN